MLIRWASSSLYQVYHPLVSAKCYNRFFSFVGSSLCRGVCSAGGWGRSGCVSFQTSHLSSVLLRSFILSLPKLLLSPLAILLSPHSHNLTTLLSSPQSPLCWTHIL